jgi:hypothetical protein
MMALTGHVTTAGAALLVWYTHAVEISDAAREAEALREALVDGDAVGEGLTDDDAATATGEADADAEREALMDADAERDFVAVGVGDTSKHCTCSRKLVEPPQPQPVQLGASCVPATMEHELRPRHDVLTIAPLPAAPKHGPCANGPDGHAPVGLP